MTSSRELESNTLHEVRHVNAVKGVLEKSLKPTDDLLKGRFKAVWGRCLD
jgi:hypothetical protein